MDELKAKIKEYGHLAATLSNQARAIPLEPKENRLRKLELHGQARDAGRQCRALIEELKRQQAAYLIVVACGSSEVTQAMKVNRLSLF